MPDGCFNSSDDTVHVKVIGWGQWANFLQRHLCHAVQQNFHFMLHQWGVPDEAKSFRAQCDESFGGLRLYPFVSRFNCTDVASYHKSVDEGFKVTVSTPQLVPAECWNLLCYHVDFAPPYDPNLNPHVNEWHSRNPLPGTVYDLGPRLDHPASSTAGMPFRALKSCTKWPHMTVASSVISSSMGITIKPLMSRQRISWPMLLPYCTYALRTVRGQSIISPISTRNGCSRQQQSIRLPITTWAIMRSIVTKWTWRQNILNGLALPMPTAFGFSNHAYWRVQYNLKRGRLRKRARSLMRLERFTRM